MNFARYWQRTIGRLTIASVAIVAMAGAAFGAEQWPMRLTTIVVAHGPGGGPVVTARLLAEALSPRLGQPAVVENHPGAGGLVGIDYAAAAKPDGYTLFLGAVDTQAILGPIRPARRAPSCWSAGRSPRFTRTTLTASAWRRIGSRPFIRARRNSVRSFSSNMHAFGAVIERANIVVD